MQTYTQCIPCFIQQAYDALQQIDGDEKLKHDTLQRVLVATASFSMERTPPEMAQITHRILRQHTGIDDPYAQIKQQSTQRALQLADEVRAVIASAVDPLKMALRFSIAGNILDFALASNWNRLNLDHFIEETRLHSLDEPSVENFRKQIGRARTLLFLGDNAGETVFDRLLIEQLPHKQIHYAVKSTPIINDATLADAREAGLDTVAKLIENGSDAPGTLLGDCTEAFRKRFAKADLVIAKGQANYESLSQTDRSIFFLTQVKCPVIGRDLNEPVGSWIVREHKGINP